MNGYWSNNKDINRNNKAKESICGDFGQALETELRSIGDFGSKISILFDEDNNPYVMDINDKKFYVPLGGYVTNPKGINVVNYSVLKECDENYYELYLFGRFTSALLPEKIYIDGDNKIISRNNPVLHSYEIDYIGKDVSYHATLINGDDVRDRFVEQNLEQTPHTLMDYINNFNEISNINKFRTIRFSSKKDKNIVGDVKFTNGRLDNLDIIEESNDDILHMWYADGEIKEDTIRKVNIPIKKTDKNLKKDYKNVKKLIKRV